MEYFRNFQTNLRKHHFCIQPWTFISLYSTLSTSATPCRLFFEISSSSRFSKNEALEVTILSPTLLKPSPFGSEASLCFFESFLSTVYFYLEGSLGAWAFVSGCLASSDSVLLQDLLHPKQTISPFLDLIIGTLQSLQASYNIAQPCTNFSPNFFETSSLLDFFVTTGAANSTNSFSLESDFGDSNGFYELGCFPERQTRVFFTGLNMTTDLHSLQVVSVSFQPMSSFRFISSNIYISISIYFIIIQTIYQLCDNYQIKQLVLPGACQSAYRWECWFPPSTRLLTLSFCLFLLARPLVYLLCLLWGLCKLSYLPLESRIVWFHHSSRCVVALLRQSPGTH